MFFIFGEKLYGKVDRVPGVFFVGTMFFHIWFVPFIPYKTMLVIDKDFGRTIRGFPMTLSIKSILAAWIRFAAGAVVVFAIIGCIFRTIAAVDKPDKWPEVWMTGGVALVAAVILWASYPLLRPGINRARRLAQIARVDPDQVQEYLLTGNNRPTVQLYADDWAEKDEALRRMCRRVE
jgi:hypothetical protein